MNDAPLTIGQAAKVLDIPKGTVRGWVNTFREFLSESAKPPKGETKLLTPDDMTVIWTVYYLRARHKSIDDIHDALAAGERHTPTPPEPETDTPPESDEAGQDAPGEGESAPKIEDAISQALALYETRLAVYDERLQDLTERLIESEKRAAIAETKLEALSILGDSETSPGGEISTANDALAADESEDKPLTRRQRLARWIGGEG